MASLQKLAAALSKKFQVSIKFQNGGGASHSTPSKKEITINTERAFAQGDDYAVGLMLHEIAHIRYSPEVSPKITEEHPRAAAEIYNWLEDRRIDGLMTEEYAGAEQFQDALSRPSLEGIQRVLETNQAGGKLPYYIAAIVLATLQAEYYDTRYCTTGNHELNSEIVPKLKTIYRSISSLSTPKDVERATKKVYELLHRWLPSEEGTKTKQVHSVVQTYGGPMVAAGGKEAAADDRYTQQDSAAKNQVESLKKKLIAKLRDNERERWIGDQKRGRLDKKRLVRVAHKNYRVYRKRLENKGKKYAFAVVLDCSGSMFNEKMNQAMKAAAMLIRAVRGLGFRSSLTIYGWDAKTVLYPSDRYSPEEIAYRASMAGGQFYHSGGNETHTGIKEALSSLYRQPGERVLVIMTDGGLEYGDIAKSKKMIKDAEKKGVKTIIYYIEAPHGRILDDEAREKIIDDSTGMVPATLELLKSLKV